MALLRCMLIAALLLLITCTCYQEQDEVGSVGDAEPTNGDSIPEFPWPPPKASCRHVVPNEYLVRGSDQPRLTDVDRILCQALDSCGYYEKSYYSVPGGFALCTCLEHIGEDGIPKDLPDRWGIKMKPAKIFSLGDYIKALFTADVGYYRLIVFIVTSSAFSQEDREITAEEAGAWLWSGANRLPSYIGQLAYTEDCATTAMVSEFKQPEPGVADALHEVPGRLPARMHLERAGLWEELAQW